MTESRLNQQINFLVELDKLKTVYRKAYLIASPNRRENSAEHSWHISVLAMVLQEYAPAGIDINRVMRMLLVHDIVEIDAGDIGVYERQGSTEMVAQKEKQAAERIFGLLPEDQKQEVLSIWNEFEAGVTPESRYARAVDRLIPLLHNYYTQGKRWKEDGITFEQVYSVNKIIANSSPSLWEFTQALINDSVAKGYLKKG